MNRADMMRLAFMTMPRTPQEHAAIRRRLADERVTIQLCHIAKCDEAEVEQQVERTGRDIHSLRAYYLASGKWPPESKPIDKNV